MISKTNEANFSEIKPELNKPQKKISIIILDISNNDEHGRRTVFLLFHERNRF